MSIKEIVICDGCGKKTEDLHSEEGWIELTGHLGFYMGREKNGSPIICTFRTSSGPNRVHYCSPTCLNRSLVDEIETQRERKKLRSAVAGTV